MRSAICRVLVILVIFSYQLSLFAQLKKLNADNLFTEREIFVDQRTNYYYSDLIRVKFAIKITNTQNNSMKIELEEITNLEVKDFLKKIESKHGKFILSKITSFKVFEDTLVRNKRTGEMVKIPNWSNVYRLLFDNLVPVDIITSELRKLKFIEYAESPFQAFSAIEPNDDKYVNGNNWAFSKIDAVNAWNITKGDSDITIAIIDKFGNVGETEIHEDLIGKVDDHFGQFGNHGRCVAGIAGAKTDNNIGIASLGWNLRLRFYDLTYPDVELLRAIDDQVDIINFSFVWKPDFNFMRDAVKTALALGIICVGAAGNDDWQVPDTLYPAAYNFGEIGQVIAVSATHWDGKQEKFIEGFNYSPGLNPLVDPIKAFIDIAAPGSNIDILDEKCCFGYSTACGTSLATPFVSALCGLVLSINEKLTPNDVYNIITETADKIGQYDYNENGWNKYLGYGRINAFKAVNKVLNITAVSDNIVDILKSRIELSQNYPNPFNPRTTIKFIIPSSSFILSEAKNLKDFSSQAPQNDNIHAVLKVYDILGKEVATLVNKEQKPGNYKVEWNGLSRIGEQVSSGIYFYKLQAGDFVETKKMILLR